MSEMLQRVSEAIRSARVNSVDPYRDLAFAAIVAMREPSQRMLDEGCHASHSDLEASWKAMIDEALK